jgi:hypothetical protein
MPTVVLRRRLFGFKPQQVHALLADRDFAVGRALERAASLEGELAGARDRVKAADQRAMELQGRALSAEERAISAEERLHGLETELLAARRELSERATPPAPKQPDEVLVGMLARGLAPIIDTARASAAAMIDEATQISEQRVGEADNVMRALQEQSRLMASWWTGMRGLFEPMLTTLDQARSGMSEVPMRVEQALSPVMNLLGEVKDQLGLIAEAAEPPPFEAPLEEDGRIVDLRGSQGEDPATTNQPGPEAGAGTAVGLRRGARAWWPEVSPSVRSAGG